MKSVEALRAETSRAATAAMGAIRRMAITLTTKALWQLTGFNLGDGNVETFNSELFGGIGFYARPPASGKPEAIAVMVGAAKTPAIVAVRDEATRSAVAGAIAEDEAMAFTSQVVFYLKSNGTIEARTVAGVALPLATKADLDALATWIHTTMIVNATGATAGTTTVPPSAAGTSVLKGQ